MERFQVGDKVNFLNEQGGGTVVKIIDTRMVLVAIEDGFEIPVLSTELVLDARAQPQKNIVEAIQKATKQQAELEAEEADNARKSSLRRFAKNSEPEGIYLAFAPHEQQWLLTGALDVLIVNHTKADLLYSFNIQNDKNIENIDYGQIGAYAKVVVETISRNDLNYWTNGIVQAILINEISETGYLPLYTPFNIRSNRFFKEGSYVMSNVLGEKAVMICLQTIDTLKVSENELYKNLKEGFGTSTAKQIVKERPAIDKHQTAPGEAVVDLHIGELVDNIADLSNHDMFKIQMDYFNKMLQSALVSDYDKITFIHGVGNGVLKNAIVKALENFKGTEKRTAAMNKFGIGAIDVILKAKGK